MPDRRRCHSKIAKKFYLRLLNAPAEGGSLVLVIGAWGQKLGIMGQPAENDVLRYLQSPG